MTSSIPVVNNAPLLDVRDLCVDFVNGSAVTHAVRGVSFQLGHEKLAIVGESGSGKSTVGRALLQLHPKKARVSASRMQFADLDLQHLSEAQMRGVRGKRISMIMQDPKYSLNPVVCVGKQIAEAWLTHHPGRKDEAKARALEMLEVVRIRQPERVYQLYPHEISGGQGQRIMIAMMLITDPELIIADEPTSALDVSVRLQVLGLLDDLVQSRGLGLIFISHDINLVRSFCDRVLVMYAGRVVESGGVRQIFYEPRHPYTRALQRSIPALQQKGAELYTIPGLPPDVSKPLPGCAFAERCEFASDRCRAEPAALSECAPAHWHACGRVSRGEL